MAVELPLFANNATSTLLADIMSDSLSLLISAEDAALFPEPDVYEYAVITVKNLATGQSEIMHCTGRTANELQVDRAQEGTTAVPFPAGSLVSMMLTAGLLDFLRDVGA